MSSTKSGTTRRRTPSQRSTRVRNDSIVYPSDEEPNNLSDTEDTAPESSRKPSRVTQKELLVNNANKWKNWWTRGTLTIAMISAFVGVIYLGHFALTALVMLIQLKFFHEIIKIGHVQYAELKLPWFRSLNWYFLFVSNYFLFGEEFPDFLLEYFIRTDQPIFVQCIRSHRFISFCGYMIGFCLYVLSLRKGYYKFQFKQFGWTHVALVMVVVISHLIIQNIFSGIFWFLVPASMVIANDCFAYLFGFFFGRTPLIKLSPKKTWEGFLGAFGSTLVWSVAFAAMLAPYPFFTCPVDIPSMYTSAPSECVRDPIFDPATYNLPPQVQMLGIKATTVSFPPVLLHVLVMAVFASLIAPFGGFFASGLKRAFKIKDFDNLIPGHGGVVDRFDCQLVQSAFANVYYVSFIKVHTPATIVAAILALDRDGQLEVYRRLQRALIGQNVDVGCS